MSGATRINRVSELGMFGGSEAFMALKGSEEHWGDQDGSLPGTERMERRFTY